MFTSIDLHLAVSKLEVASSRLLGVVGDQTAASEPATPTTRDLKLMAGCCSSCSCSAPPLSPSRIPQRARPSRQDGCWLLAAYQLPPKPGQTSCSSSSSVASLACRRRKTAGHAGFRLSEVQTAPRHRDGKATACLQQ